MKFASTILSAVLFVCGGLAANGQSLIQTVETKGGITTLYAIDPLAQSICMKDGSYGSIFQEGQVRNACSDVNFNSYSPNGLSSGIEGGRQAVLVDLGSSNDLQKKYGYTETVGHGEGFASITRKGGKILILKDYRARTLQELSESGELFGNPASSSVSLPVKTGHIYLVRITDESDKSFERVAKLLVIGFVPDQSVTFRWELLSDAKAN